MTWCPCELLGRAAVRESWWWVGLFRRAALENFAPFCTICRVLARSAGEIWAFYSVSGEILARSRENLGANVSSLTTILARLKPTNGARTSSPAPTCVRLTGLVQSSQYNGRIVKIVRTDLEGRGGSARGPKRVRFSSHVPEVLHGRGNGDELCTREGWCLVNSAHENSALGHVFLRLVYT